jgi:hypothetical protein
MLLECFGQWESGELDAPGCGWFNTPPQPGTRAAETYRRDQQRAQEQFAGSSEAAALDEWVSELSGDVSFGPQG